MEPGRNLSLPTLANLRDLGGYACAGGRTVAEGVLFRSRALDLIADDDLATLRGWGIATVVDLRTAEEVSLAPDRLAQGMSGLRLDVLAGSPDAAPAQVIAIERDPHAAAEMFGDGRGAAMFEHGYREMVVLPSAHRAYGAFFAAILESPTTPWLFHCTNGKDRTGLAAAALLLLCGVSQRDVEHDFLLTNRDLLPFLAPVFESFEAAGGDPDLLQVVLGVDVNYLRASIDQIRLVFGSVESWFADALGLDAAAQAELVAALTR